MGHNIRVKRLAALLSLGMLGCVGAWISTDLLFNKPQQITTPHLITTHEQYASIQSLQGHLVYLAFGFTNCVEVCPMTLASLKKLSTKLGHNVEFIFVSADNQRDDLQTLQTYLGLFDENIIGWRMQGEQLAEFASQFGATVDSTKTLKPGKSVGIHVIDPAGKLIKTYSYTSMDVSEIVNEYHQRFAEISG